MWICPKCGTFNSEETESCTVCGVSKGSGKKNNKKALKSGLGSEKRNKMKRTLLLITALSMVVIAIAAVVVSVFLLDHQPEVTPEVIEDREIEEEEEEEIAIFGDGTLRMATFANAYDTGMMEMLRQEFYADTGIILEVLPVGVEEALSAGRAGEVDLVFVNDPMSEELFVEEGHGIERIPVMYNDFIVVGPGDLVGDEVEVAGLLFTLVEVLELPFISLGDNSGEHQMEMAIWRSLELDPTVNPNYSVSEQGMSDAIQKANDEGALILVDRGMWVVHSWENEMELIILCEGDSMLFNLYSILAVNPAMHPGVNHEEASIFIDWIQSERAQALIGAFGAEQFGEPLFVPGVGMEDRGTISNDIEDTNDTNDIEE